MTEIAWHLLQPVDVGAQTMAGFQTGMALTKRIQTTAALRDYMANPDDPNAAGALAYFDPETLSTLETRRQAQLKAQRETQDRERAVALGELAVADPRAARDEALAAGDFDLADHFSKISNEDLERSGKFWEKAGPLAFALKQEPDPAKRQALFQQSLPILQATGAPPELLQNFDPTNDAQLDAAISTGQTIAQQIEQRRITWHQQGESPSFATDYMGRPVGSGNPYRSGATATPPPAAPAAAQGAVGNVLSAAGLPAHVVSGFLGNFAVEGGYGGASGDGGSAAGLAQWRGERQAKFQQVIGKPVGQATPEEQAQFVLWEMQNPEEAGMTVDQRDAILNAKDAGEAADLIDRYYERSSGQHRPHRVAAALQIAGTSGVPRITGDDDFHKLPPGAVFIAPDGTRRVKP